MWVWAVTLGSTVVAEAWTVEWKVQWGSGMWPEGRAGPLWTSVGLRGLTVVAGLSV